MKYILAVQALVRQRFDVEFEADSAVDANRIGREMFDAGEWGDDAPYAEEGVDAEFSVKEAK